MYFRKFVSSVHLRPKTSSRKFLRITVEFIMRSSIIGTRTQLCGRLRRRRDSLLKGRPRFVIFVTLFEIVWLMINNAKSTTSIDVRMNTDVPTGIHRSHNLYWFYPWRYCWLFVQTVVWMCRKKNVNYIILWITHLRVCIWTNRESRPRVAKPPRM